MEHGDKELLELAAKSAGVKIKYNYLGAQDARCPWKPLEDDGDALRLAVKLDITIYVNRVDGLTTVEYGYSTGTKLIEYHGSDPYAATRLAIVRAAAEIGRNMK